MLGLAVAESQGFARLTKTDSVASHHHGEHVARFSPVPLAAVALKEPVAGLAPKNRTRWAGVLMERAADRVTGDFRSGVGQGCFEQPAVLSECVNLCAVVLHSWSPRASMIEICGSAE